MTGLGALSVTELRGKDQDLDTAQAGKPRVKRAQAGVLGHSLALCLVVSSIAKGGKNGV